MLTCRATGVPTLTPADAVTVFVDTFGAELENPDLGYFLLNRAGPDDDGAHHYVELSDQSFGRFDGVKCIAIAPDLCSLTLHLKFDVNGQGREFAFSWSQPMSDAATEWLKAFVREVSS